MQILVMDDLGFADKPDPSLNLYSYGHFESFLHVVPPLSLKGGIFP